MAGLPWVKVATDFVDHPKAVALGDRLGDPRAALHLPALWGYFARRYPAGAMPDTADAVQALERAVLWTGEPGRLVGTLVEVELLERRRGHLHVHDWIEWQEAHARKLERDRERMRAKRADCRKNGRTTVAEESRDGRAKEEIERRGEGEEAEEPSPSPVAPSARRTRRAGKTPDPQHHELQLRLEATFLRIRGTAYGFQGGRDAKAVATLITFAGGDLDEIVRRWQRALELERKWPGCSSLSALVARWNDLARGGHGPVAPSQARRQGAPVPAGGEAEFPETRAGGF